MREDSQYRQIHRSRLHVRLGAGQYLSGRPVRRLLDRKCSGSSASRPVGAVGGAPSVCLQRTDGNPWRLRLVPSNGRPTAPDIRARGEAAEGSVPLRARAQRTAAKVTIDVASLTSPGSTPSTTVTAASPTTTSVRFPPGWSAGASAAGASSHMRRMTFR